MSKPLFALPILGFAALALTGCVGQAQALTPASYLPNSGYAAQSPRGERVAYGVTCSAGAYTCALPAEAQLGAPCSCPGLGAPSFGNVR